MIEPEWDGLKLGFDSTNISEDGMEGSGVGEAYARCNLSFCLCSLLVSSAEPLTQKGLSTDGVGVVHSETSTPASWRYSPMMIGLKGGERA